MARAGERVPPGLASYADGASGTGQSGLIDAAGSWGVALPHRGGTQLAPSGPGDAARRVQIPSAERAPLLVARARELERLERLLTTTRREGRAAFVAIRGEPGVGKSALLEVTVGRAVALGFAVVRVRGQEPLLTTRDGILDSVLEAFERARSAWSAAPVPRAVPAARGRRIQPDRLRRSIGGSLAALERSTAGPVLVALEDAHFVPPLFGEALVQAVRALPDRPIVVVATVTDVPHLEADLGWLDDVEQHELGGLTPSQAATLLWTRQHVAPPTHVVEGMVTLTAGNPRALIELPSLVDADELAGIAPLPVPLPVSKATATAFARGIERFGPEGVELLALVALARLPLAFLVELLEQTGRAMERLEETFEAGVLLRRAERVEFAHPLVASAAVTCVDDPTRCRLHQALAAFALEHGWVERAASHALAAHGESATQPDATLATLLDDAALAASLRADPTAAALFRERAASRVDPGEPQAVRLVDAARKWLQSGNPARAAACLARVERGPRIVPATRVEHRHVEARVRMRSEPPEELAEALATEATEAARVLPQVALEMLVDAVGLFALAGSRHRAHAVALEAVELGRLVSSQAEAAGIELLRLLQATDGAHGAPDAPPEVAQRGDPEALGNGLPSQGLEAARAVAQRAPTRAQWRSTLHRPSVSGLEDPSGVESDVESGVERGIEWGIDPGIESTVASPGAVARLWGLPGLSSSPLAVSAVGLLLAELQGADDALALAACADAALGDGEQGMRCAANFVRGVALLRAGRLAEACARLGEAGLQAEAAGVPSLAVLARGFEALGLATMGLDDEVFAAAAWALQPTHRAGRLAKALALSALAELELAHQELDAARAWAGASRRHLASANLVLPTLHEATAWGTSCAETPSADVPRASAIGASVVWTWGAGSSAWASYLAGLRAHDPDSAASAFELARRHARPSPLFAARTDLRDGERLVASGRVADGVLLLDQAAARFERMEATGWAALARRKATDATVHHHAAGAAALGRDGRPGASATPAPTRSGAAADASRSLDAKPNPSRAVGLPSGADLEGTDERGLAPVLGLEPGSIVDAAAVPSWEVQMLGGFALRRNGEPLALAPSLPVQALKIVALRGRLLAEELVELLWPGADPATSAPRLRNVLFKLRRQAGELVVRDGPSLRLAEGVDVDATIFKSLANQALTPGVDQASAVERARHALALYRGELLPDDRYEDWASAPRERLASLAARLLDLVLGDAIEAGRSNEALHLLDRLIELEPYEERHYLTAAELHNRLGNRQRALSMLARAERAIAHLGVRPSRALHVLQRRLEAT
jgi:DNA-binding SARP family transcriptional activator